MAAGRSVQSLQVEATCSICLEYYKDPVTTKCGHNFCRPCVTGRTQGAVTALPCPQCRQTCLLGDLRPNRQLQSIVDLVKQLSVQRKRPREEETLCEERPREEETLCEEHGEKLQLLCKDDEKLLCLVCWESNDHELHTVLPIKEAAMQYKDVRSTLSRCEDVTPQTPEGIRKRYKVRVTLDPDSAHRSLVLSEDGRRVTWTRTEQRLPDNPKRFTVSESVLGREGFSSGRHYWELQLLQEELGWVVGVARESVGRKERVRELPEGGVWAVQRQWYRPYEALTSPPAPLSPSQPPLKLGLYLDYGGGRLSVYNADTGEEIYTFTGAAFTGAVHPYFSLYGSELRLL